jgi:DUF4097 and DUF4098 domain-containing protein YvlB
MRHLAAACVIAGIVCGATAGAADAQSRYPVRDDRTVTRTLRFSGSGDRTLDVRAVTGSIQVTAADVPNVEIEVRRITRARSDADLREAERDVTLDFVENDARVRAVVRHAGGLVCGETSNQGQTWPRRYDVAFEFTIRVPRRTNLQLCAMNGQDIRVEGTDGEFDIKHLNGRITMRDIRGGGSAETLNGPVTVVFAEAPRSATWLKTLNGNVDATFPAALSADFVLKTRHGELLTDFDVEVLPQPVAAAERRNGKFVYRSNDAARVRVGQGGPEISMETMNGDVRVIRAGR